MAGGSSLSDGEDTVGEDREDGIPEGRPGGACVVESVRKASTESAR